MNYIEKLNALRVAKDLSVRELGSLCELSEPSVRKILYKKCSPLVPSIEKLCATLGISLSELFCGTDEIVLKASADAVALIAIFDVLPTEAKSHLLWAAKNLYGK
jgi:transcriptional regulator with XRE-family HTH domain